mgnify:CR=1 FL=1
MKVIVTGRGIRRPARRIEREFGISRREAVALKHKRCLHVSQETGDKLIAAGLAIAAPPETPVLITPEDNLVIVTPEDDAVVLTAAIVETIVEEKIDAPIRPPKRSYKGGGR